MSSEEPLTQTLPTVRRHATKGLGYDVVANSFRFKGITFAKPQQRVNAATSINIRRLLDGKQAVFKQLFVIGGKVG